jgi:hypothetical protein
MKRLEFRDRRYMLSGAMVSAELYNVHRDREKVPEPFRARDFLPEFPEERLARLRREALAEKENERAPSDAELEAYKQSLVHGFKKPGQKP